MKKLIKRALLFLIVNALIVFTMYIVAMKYYSVCNMSTISDAFTAVGTVLVLIVLLTTMYFFNYGLFTWDKYKLK